MCVVDGGQGHCIRAERDKDLLERKDEVEESSEESDSP
eukprot:SAG31_NODE_3870_length_3798_cov_2.788862_6_plen_38_part_00